LKRKKSVTRRAAADSTGSTAGSHKNRVAIFMGPGQATQRRYDFLDV